MEVLQCDVCPAQFIKAKALKNHKQRTHDIGLPEVLACDRFIIVAFSRFFTLTFERRLNLRMYFQLGIPEFKIINEYFWLCSKKFDYYLSTFNIF